MSLKEIIKTMYTILDRLTKDLKKVEKNNKAASQRVRTGTINLAKIAKKFRKESILEEKKNKALKNKKKLKKRKSEYRFLKNHPK